MTLSGVLVITEGTLSLTKRVIQSGKHIVGDAKIDINIFTLPYLARNCHI